MEANFDRILPGDGGYIAPARAEQDPCGLESPPDPEMGCPWSCTVGARHLCDHAAHTENPNDDAEPGEMIQLARWPWEAPDAE